jgi:hypothetical protein
MRDMIFVALMGALTGGVVVWYVGAAIWRLFDFYRRLRRW